MERIREFLEIERWVVFGGSWGSTLALAYAQTHPERVLGLILRGIFLARDEDVNWFFNGSAARVFPEAWQHFIEPIPVEERDDIVAAYYERLTSSNEIVRMGAAKAWSIWEGSSVTLCCPTRTLSIISAIRISHSASRASSVITFGIIVSFRPNQLLDEMSKIAEIPGYIVHGRYDMVCPIDQAVYC